MPARRTVAAAALLPAVLLVAACGGGGDDSSSTTASPSARPTGGPGGGMDPEQFQQLRDCLTAAGIAVPTARPSFDGTPPSGGTRPTDLPSGPPPGGSAPGGGMFQSAEAQAAIKACGLTLPTMPPDPSRSP